MISSPDSRHIFWMNKALQLANLAEQQGEVPIGAVVVLNDAIIGEGWNQPILTNDPTAHAEIIALRAAAKTINNYRLVNSTLYTTVEPCIMCAGAIIHARIKTLIYGADDPKAGAIHSAFNFLETNKLNHQIEWQKGILAEDCGTLLKNFFLKRRTLKSYETNC